MEMPGSDRGPHLGPLAGHGHGGLICAEHEEENAVHQSLPHRLQAAWHGGQVAPRCWSEILVLSSAMSRGILRLSHAASRPHCEGEVNRDSISAKYSVDNGHVACSYLRRRTSCYSLLWSTLAPDGPDPDAGWPGVGKRLYGHGGVAGPYWLSPSRLRTKWRNENEYQVLVSKHPALGLSETCASDASVSVRNPFALPCDADQREAFRQACTCIHVK